MTERIWLSLGSNIERERNIRSAVAALRERYAPLLVSPVYESEAVGFTGDPFFNLVVGFDSDRPAADILAELRDIEAAHGRQRGADKFDARTLDIDLLTYGSQRLRVGGIELPREQIARYAFVLKPLAQIAPNEIHLPTGKTYLQLWQGFDASHQPLWPVDLRWE